jgi:hypothetical protein
MWDLLGVTTHRERLLTGLLDFDDILGLGAFSFSDGSVEPAGLGALEMRWVVSREKKGSIF